MSVARSAGWADTAVLVMAVLAAAVTGNDAGVWPAVLVEHGRVSGALPAGGSNHYVSPSLLKLLPLGDSITWGYAAVAVNIPRLHCPAFAVNIPLLHCPAANPSRLPGPTTRLPPVLQVR